MSYIHDAGVVALSTVTVDVLLWNGDDALVECSLIDAPRIEGITIKPFLDNQFNYQVFVLKDNNGESTNYEKPNGKLVTGKSIFHFMGRYLKQNYHLKDNDWKNLTRQNWEPRPTLSPQERYIRRALAMSITPLEGELRPTL